VRNAYTMCFNILSSAITRVRLLFGVHGSEIKRIGELHTSILHKLHSDDVLFLKKLHKHK